MPKHAEEIMQGFGQKYFEEGIAFGEARGKAEGEARVLVRLLEKRIGAVPETLRAHFCGRFGFHRTMGRSCDRGD